MVCWVAQSCPTLCYPMDCSPPVTSVHGDSPGKNTGVICHALLQGIFLTLELNQSLLHCRWILYQLSYQGSPVIQWYLFINQMILCVCFFFPLDLYTFLLVCLAIPLIIIPQCLNYRIGLPNFTELHGFGFWWLWIIVQFRRNGYFWNTESLSLPMNEYGALHLFWCSLVSLNNVLWQELKVLIMWSPRSLLPTLFSATFHYPCIFPTSLNFLKCLEYKKANS